MEISARRFLSVALLFLVLFVLHTDAANTTMSGGDRHRKLMMDKCRSTDLALNQGLSTEFPHGVPTYTVEIHNQCSSGCNIGRIHLHCGEFSSEIGVSSFVLRRVSYDECVLNDGRPIAFGEVVSFQYATIKPYALAVADFTCF